MAYNPRVTEPVAVEATTDESTNALENAKEDALNRLNLPEPATFAEDTSKETQETGEGEEEEKKDEEAAASTAPAAEDAPFPSPATSAALDMILTVVGEFYGQRDLLESRKSW
jgi:hypothetical protein